jgi:transposase InsO family protein
MTILTFCRIQNKFENDCFKLYHSDNGGEFISNEIKTMVSSLDGTFVHGAPRHPQSQDQVERVNGTIKRKLRTFLHDNPGQWSNYLQTVTKQYNCTVHSTINMTPWKVKQ